MAHVVRFGRFELDLDAGELRSGGIRVRLQEQPFRVLTCLIERPGELVTRADLQARLWNDGRFVDFEHGLNAAIKRLRAALEDDAESPRFVETVQRRGYRFLVPVEYPDTTTRTAASREAHDAYVKGLYHWTRPGDSGLDEAIAFLDVAITADPGFAAAHSLLGRAYVAAAEYYTRPPREALEAARASAARALELDSCDANAYVAAGDVKRSLEWDWDGAERAYRDALAANPRSEAALRRYGLLLATRGDTHDGIDAALRACEMDPLCLVINTNAALVLYLCADYERAVAHCRHTLDMDGAFAPALHVLAMALVQLNRHGEALRAVGAPDLPNDPLGLAVFGYVAAASGEHALAAQSLNALDRTRVERIVSPFHLARIEATVGRRDAAVTLLRQAVEERDPALYTLPLDPGFSGIRADARVVRLVRELRLRRTPPPLAAAG